MLTVIAIIGILAAILLPALRTARNKARMTQAQSNINNIELAVKQYELTFGAFPPDRVPWDTVNDEPESWPLPQDLSPNECLVWFLTRTFTTDDETAAGVPWHTSEWDPATATEVFARVSHKPSLNIKEKQKRDDDRDGFYEFVDAWSQPYMYRAYPRTDFEVTSITHDGANEETIYAIPGVEAARCSNVNCGWTGPVEELDGGNCPDCLATVDLLGFGILGIRGMVRISGCKTPSNNGTFEFHGDTATSFKVSKEYGGNEGPADWTDPPVVSFPLRNAEECDIYSLGPNGRTRSGLSPDAVESWNPRNAPRDWGLFWGTPGDGNDVPADRKGNLNVEEKDQDDINNWSG